PGMFARGRGVNARPVDIVDRASMRIAVGQRDKGERLYCGRNDRDFLDVLPHPDELLWSQQLAQLRIDGSEVEAVACQGSHTAQSHALAQQEVGAPAL